MCFHRGGAVDPTWRWSGGALPSLGRSGGRCDVGQSRWFGHLRWWGRSSGRRTPHRGVASVTVVTAGTADLPVAEECAATLTAHGLRPARITDIGVAGLHRVLDAVDELAAADAIVVVAGMEGALASVVGGLTAAPVVAVPTSVGYGASLQGVTALLGMLASCASGLTVVGIDNGFGAACAVLRMLNLRTLQRTDV